MKNLKNKIISSIAISAIVFVFTSKADDQSAEFGVRFMPTVSAFDLQTSSGGNIKGEATLGYGIGALLGFNFSDHVGVQGEVI